jgi:hypothetical protein
MCIDPRDIDINALSTDTDMRAMRVVQMSSVDTTPVC